MIGVESRSVCIYANQYLYTDSTRGLGMAKGTAVFDIPRTPIKAGVGLAILVVILTVIFHFVPISYRATIVFLGAGLAAAGAIAGAFYTGRILKFYMEREERTIKEEERRAEQAHQDVLRREENARKEIAFKYGERWNNPAMYYSRKACREIISKRKNPQAIKDELLNDPDVRTNVNNVLNFLDELALSVREGRADNEIAKRQFGGLVQHFFSALRLYREHWVVDFGREDVWAELNWLYNQWAKPGIRDIKEPTP